MLLSALNILEGYNLGRLGDRTAESIHLIAEAYRRAYMDRAEYLGDPDYNHIPTAALTAKKYADAWRRSILGDSATASASLHRPEGFLAPAPKTAGQRKESQDTTHYSVVDREGNAVSVTTTLNDSFGSRVTAGSLGFLLNDEMDDFAVKQGVPNIFGLIQGPANAIAPGKRPLSSMTPTIVLEKGKLRYVLGSPGGARIVTTVANIFLSAAEGGLNIQQAVDAPRFHHQYMPDKLYLEPGFSEEAIAGLRAMGYTLEHQRRPLVQRGVHRHRPQNRRTARRPGPPQPLRQGRGLLTARRGNIFCEPCKIEQNIAAPERNLLNRRSPIVL